jgi:hypothetical protein
MPAIGLLYEINTDNINVRRPHLTTFAGHQAALGSEYISDTDIPQSDVKLKYIHITSDFLHDAQDIEPSVNAKSEVRKILDKREERLEKADWDLYNIADKKSLLRMSFSQFSSEFAVMRKLYGESELAMKSPEELPRDTDDEIKDYLICKQYAETGLDFKAFRKLFRQLDSGKAVEEYRTSLQPVVTEVKLDPALEIGHELEMQKQASQLDDGVQF